jgi:hypothetical protein
MWPSYSLAVQVLGDLLERHPLLNHPSDPHTPAIVLSVAEHVREPDVPGDKLSAISLEPGVVIRRWRPIRQRSGSRLETAPPLRAIALRHLAAEFDDLAALRHLDEDTACAERL